MDDYTLKTVKLLLERNKEYLFEILEKLNIEVDNNAENICKLLHNRENDKKIMHKSSIYTCTKCNSKYVTTEEVQVRSSDEGSSIVHFCNACGNRWF